MSIKPTVSPMILLALMLFCLLISACNKDQTPNVKGPSGPPAASPVGQPPAQNN